MFKMACKHTTLTIFAVYWAVGKLLWLLLLLGFPHLQNPSSSSEYKTKHTAIKTVSHNALCST